LSLSDALAAARGKVRDGVSAIENLDQLLGSRRVGPRQLPHAILGVQEGCVQLLDALVELETQMATHLRGDAEGIASVASILAHASGLVRELVDTLKGREKAAIDARERLRLESIVHRIAVELDTVMRLTDLLSASAPSRRTAPTRRRRRRARSATSSLDTKSRPPLEPLGVPRGRPRQGP
jgi:hypothetical protein